MILPALAADLDAIERIANEAFDVPWPRAELRRELTRPHASVRVLRPAADAPVVAFANYWRLGDELEIMNVATAKRARRCGYGRALVDYVLEQARAQALSVVSLEVRASNHAALALYASIGFERTGIRPRYYSDNGEDAVRMLCKL